MRSAMVQVNNFGPVCLFVCLSVCQTITFASLDVGSSHSHMHWRVIGLRLEGILYWGCYCKRRGKSSIDSRRKEKVAYFAKCAVLLFLSNSLSLAVYGPWSCIWQQNAAY